jgi:hypothetical protein
MRSLLYAVLLHSALAQQRCKLQDVRQVDGTYAFGHCDELLLFGEHIGDEGAASLANALGSGGAARLKLLDLWSNGIGPNGAAALAKALETNTALQKLYLNENPIGPQGASSLARVLINNRALQSLWISRCNVGDAGADAIAGALPRARRLEALDLWGNGITSIGGKAIAAALHNNHNPLRTLELRDNPMGDETARAFAEMMPKNIPLATLDLVSTGTTSAGIAALLAGLKLSTARPYLVVFADGLPHLQATSWEQQGKANAP